jgi:hypothetical protein
MAAKQMLVAKLASGVGAEAGVEAKGCGSEVRLD